MTILIFRSPACSIPGLKAYEVKWSNDYACTAMSTTPTPPFETRLGAGELAALSGLGPLRHLDLDLVRVGEVVRRDAESPGGHLLDRRPSVVRETLGVLASLPGVGTPADLVHLSCHMHAMYK